MKNCGGGNKHKLFVRSAKCVLIVLVLLWDPPCRAAAAHRSWIFDQLGAPPIATAYSHTRHQASLGAVNYDDTLSNQASLLADFRYFEIRATGSQRLFLDFAPTSSTLRNGLAGESQLVAIEIARYHVTAKNQYGRLGAEVIQFLPGNSRWLKVGISTGVLDSAALPWRFQWSANFFLRTVGTLRILNLGAEVMRALTFNVKNQVEFGGFMSWFSVSTTGPADMPYEHMLFSFGPSLQWTSSWGALRAALPLRLWLDGQADSASSLTTYPSDLGAPALSLNLTVTL